MTGSLQAEAQAGHIQAVGLRTGVSDQAPEQAWQGCYNNLCKTSVSPLIVKGLSGGAPELAAQYNSTLSFVLFPMVYIYFYCLRVQCVDIVKC